MQVFRALGLATVFAASAFVAASPASAAADKTMPSCSAGDSVVWENTKSGSHVYHVQGDKYFGNTSSGKYACKSAADSAGYHAAGSGSSSGTSKGKHKGSSAAATATAAPDADAPTSPDPNATGSKKHKHHHQGSSSASPSPSATST